MDSLRPKSLFEIKFEVLRCLLITFKSLDSALGHNGPPQLATSFQSSVGLEAKEKRKENIVLLYDLSTAFDAVSHEILLTKLQIYGFDNQATNWMKSFLQHRRQMVLVSGKMSSTQDIKICAHQGSRLAPLLFICLMPDLDQCVQKVCY